MVNMKHGTRAVRIDFDSAFGVSPSPARKSRSRGMATLWTLAAAALLMIVRVGTAMAGGPEHDVMVLKRQDFEVHPGPRETCPLCAARIQDLKNFQGDVLVPPEGDMLLARSWGREAGAKDTLFVADYSRNPAAARKVLHSSPKRVIVVNNLPADSAEARAIFGRPVGNQITEISNAQRQVSAACPTAKVINLCGEGKTSIDDLRRIMATTTENDLVVVVAHVKKGGIIPLNNEGSIKLAELCSYRGRVCALGCNTAPSVRLRPESLEIGTLSRLSPNDAVRSLEMIHGELRLGGTYRDALLKVQNASFKGKAGRPETVEQIIQDLKTPLIGMLSTTLLTIGLNEDDFPTER